MQRVATLARMEGYFNFGFTNSVRKSSAWFLGQRATESNYKIDVEWSCDSVERNSIEDVDTIDTDLDSDSFLSDLERDSGEQRSESRGQRSHRYSDRDWQVAVQRGSTTDRVVEGEEEVGVGVEGREARTPAPNWNVSQGSSSSSSSSDCCCYFTRLDVSCITGLVSLSALIFSLIAPDWVTNTHNGSSSLTRLNPWDVCLDSLEVRTNTTLRGCWTSWDSRIQPRLLPHWFIAVPASLLISSSLSLSARALVFLIWFKKRQIFPLKLGVKLMVTVTVLDALTGLLLLSTAMMFAASVLASPSLSPAPSELSLSWGWAASLSSSWGHLATATLMARSSHLERKKRAQNEIFIRNIQS